MIGGSIMKLPYLSAIKRNKFIKQLTKAGAFSADNAKTLEELGIFNSGVTFELLYDNVISATGNGRYYINKN